MANKYAFEAVGAEENNIKFLTETMWEIKDRLFDTLLTAQRASIGIKRYDTRFTADLWDNIQNGKISFTTPLQFIHLDDRINYRNDDRGHNENVYRPPNKRGETVNNFYKKEITDDTVVKNRDVFSSRMLVFIDGKLYTNFTVKPYEDKTTVYFKVYYKYVSAQGSWITRDGLLKTEIDNFIENDSRVTFLVFPNFESASSLETYSNRNISNGLIRISSFRIDSDNRTLTADDINKRFMCIVSSDADNFCSHKIVETEIVGTNIRIKDASNKLPDYRSPNRRLYNFKLLILPNFNEERTLLPNINYFSLNLKDSPIPTESVILFKQDSNNDIVFDHDSRVNLYYPNVYNVNKSDNKHKMIALSFYVTNFGTLAKGYSNEVRLYHRFATDIVRGIADDIADLYNNTINYINEEFNYNGLLLEYQSVNDFSNISKVIINDKVMESKQYEYDSITHKITFKEPPGIVTERLTADGVTRSFTLVNGFVNDVMSVNITTPERSYTPTYMYNPSTRIITFNNTPEPDSLITIKDRIQSSFTIEFADAVTETTSYNNETVRKMTIPEYIKNYEPSGGPYSIPDYLLGTEISHLQYKIDKLINLIDKNGDHYAVYLDKINRSMPRVDVQYDLNDIITVNDANKSSYGVDFSLWEEESVFEDPENKYIPITLKYTEDMPILYVNNRYYYPKYQYHDKSIRHIFIPYSLFDDNTMIKAEFLTNFYFTQQFTSTSVNEYVPIEINENYRISALDLFITYHEDDGSENGINRYLPKSEYELYKSFEYDNNGRPIYIRIQDDEFYPYTLYYVRLTSERYLNQTLTIRTASDSFLINNIDGDTRFVINEPFDDGREGMEITVKHPLIVKNDLSRFLFFKNGQLVPKQAIREHFSNKINGPHTFDIILHNVSTDIFTLVYPNVTYTPVDLTNHPNVMSIPENGVVDLTGYIDKPLNFKWYDIYLNGNRMNENTAEFLGPYILRIHNVTTRKHLEIYEKNFHNLNSVGDTETNDSTTYIYRNLLQDLTFDFDPIDDTDPDILDDLIVDYIGFLDELRMRWKIINPDILQLTTKMVNKYHGISVSETDLNVFINPDEYLDMGKSVFINPSHTYEYEGEQERV